MHETAGFGPPFFLRQSKCRPDLMYGRTRVERIQPKRAGHANRRYTAESALEIAR
jgi:hypothetical protein